MIPGGTPAAAHLHVCRTVCRRAERRALAVEDAGNPEVVRYLNRLSDLLFILSRAANQPDGAGARPESLWDPGGHRSRRRRAGLLIWALARTGQRRSAARRAASASAVHSTATR